MTSKPTRPGSEPGPSSAPTVWFALTRGVSPAIDRCELTHLARTPIDLAAARRQHRAYKQCLAQLGCRVVHLPAEPDLPDSVFVEDAAIVFDELAVITRPGAASRRPETTSIRRALAPYRPLATIRAPATLDGGDVLQLGRRVFVGLSSRSGEQALTQLGAILEPLGYEVSGVPLRGCLHLKTAVTQVGPDLLLINRDWVDAGPFGPVRCIDVDPAEPNAANALLLDDRVIYPAEYPRTRARLQAHGVQVMVVPASELAKAEGGVTCCSLIFRI